MEARERYDPEDIEHLLRERSYDELLAEERAYVLRHLSGRAEYEAMRALLHQVRAEGPGEPITAGEGTRARVIDAFRERNRPRWGFSLNSLGTLLWPREASAMWRPALALGALVLLVAGGFHLARYAGGDGAASVAEVRPAKTVEPETRESAPPKLREAHAESLQEEQDALTGSGPGEANAQAVAGPVSTPERPLVETGTMVASSVADAADAPQEHLLELEDRHWAADDRESLGDSVGTAGYLSRKSRVVSEEELARNESFAYSQSERTRSIIAPEAKGKAASKAEDKSLPRGRNLGQDPALLDLIATGW